MQPEINIGQVAEFSDATVISNGRHFIRTTWHGIAVIENVETGYYSAVDPCKKYGKLFKDWRVNKKTQEFLAIASGELGLSSEPTLLQKNEQETETNLPRRIPPGSLIVEILDVSKELRGTFIHQDIFHSFAEWISPEYSFKVSRLMNLLNERNKLTHQTLEQTIAQLQTEIKSLKSERDELEDQLLDKELELGELKDQNDHKKTVLESLETELISRAEKIERQAETIRDLTTPINQLAEPPIIYAKPIGENTFQLKYAQQPISPRVATLKRMSVVNAKDILKQAMNTLKANGTAIKTGQNYVINREHLDEVFELITEIKNGESERIANERNAFLDKEIERVHSLSSSAQNLGKLFELNYIKGNAELTPWALIPKSILNTFNESRKDTGIDAVVIDGEQIIEIVQIKHHKNTYLKREEIDSFIQKSLQERYANVQKKLIVNGCKISSKIRNELASNGIELVIV